MNMATGKGSKQAGVQLNPRFEQFGLRAVVLVKPSRNSLSEYTRTHDLLVQYEELITDRKQEERRSYGLLTPKIVL
jgi:hypothetical protein